MTLRLGLALLIFEAGTAPLHAAEPAALAAALPLSGVESGVAMQHRAVLRVDGAPGFAHLTIGRDQDLVGQPVAMMRPVRTAWSGSPGSLAFTGSLPSGMPVAARALTSPFGMRYHPLTGGLMAHRGIDLAASAGSPVEATADGIVASAGWAGGYGLCVTVSHGGGLQTRYGHLSRLTVAAGQQVHRGDLIGLVGSTGLSTGPHLHYEVRVNGQAINPLATIRRR